MQGVNETWKLLEEEFEDLSNILAPTKVTQHCSNFHPYIDDEIRDLGNQVKLKFNHAISTKLDYD